MIKRAEICWFASLQISGKQIVTADSLQEDYSLETFFIQLKNHSLLVSLDKKEVV